MKISIIGYGKMGQTVAEAAREKQIQIVSTIDPHHPAAMYKEITAEAVKDAEACICFTVPAVAVQNIKDLSALKKPIVMATTGWLDQMHLVRELVAKSGNGLIYSSNFSLGVNLFFKILEPALKVFNQFEDYDVMGWELHHNRKEDAPSGTAKTIEKIILQNFTRKKQVIEERPDRRMPPDAFHFASVRGGDIPGTHTVRFDSAFDSIEITHSARNRMGFAYGALLAARWIKTRQGVFTEDDMLKAYLEDLRE